MKWYRVPFDYVIYDMSYANVILYGAVIPSFDSDRDKDGKPKKNEKVIDATDPANKDMVKNLFMNMK